MDIQRTFFYLCEINDFHTVSLSMRNVVKSPCYSNEEKTIYLDDNTINKQDVIYSCWIMAHEFRHALQHQKNIAVSGEMKDLVKIKNYTIIGLFFHMYLSLMIGSYTTLLFNNFGLSIFVLYLLFIGSKFVFFNPWLCKKSLILELDADQYANKILGIGCPYNIKKTSNKYLVKLQPIVDFICNYVLLDKYILSTHPSHKERKLNAQSFSPNTELLKKLNIG